MFDIGWTEMMVVAIVAILFVGPKELPGMLRMAGRTVKKIRGMAGDVQRQFDDALREAELDDMKASIDQVRDLNPTKVLKDKLNPVKDDLENTAREINEDAPLVFDESKAPTPAEPVKVDVEAALARQKALDETTAKAKTPAKKAATRKPAAKKTVAAKSAAKKPVAAKKTARKPAAKKAAKAAT